MSLQPAIPWRVGLHQSPPPLHRPGSECITVDLPVDSFAASGQQCLIRLSQPRGPPQFVVSGIAPVAPLVYINSINSNSNQNASAFSALHRRFRSSNVVRAISEI